MKTSAFFALLLLGFHGVGATGESNDEAELLNRGVALAVDGRYRPALELFQQLLQKDPEDPIPLYYVGISYYFTGELDRARVFLEKSCAEEADFPQPYYWLARLLYEEKKLPPARKVLEEGLKKFPEHEKMLLLAPYLEETEEGP